ncbi:transglycosylase domain-containing protein [Nonomuraea sp. NPDC003804]|uniref:transglycosylase domain-containing protein n=1 Tax=Nonomuraea sp. NPDC003804 TaxID=3154547 RepID=UPI0033BC8EF2
MAIAFGAGILATVALFGVAWAMTPIPDSTQKEATAQGSVIYYRDGKTVLAKQGVNRKNVKLAQVPPHVRDAVIAAENRSFYTDSGVSLKGTARAVWSTVTGQQLQGGSTITQQMVRNYYSGLSQERSITRKFKEILISIKVDQSKSKDWVLEQYLNTIYFGRGANGVQAAAQAYFGKNVESLTVAEGAYLAAVIQQPSRFADPKGGDRAAAEARWRAVVDAMVQTGALTAADAAKQDFPELKKPRAAFALKGQDQVMVDRVREELNARGYTDEQIDSGGLKIVTTFDKNLMGAAERAVKSVLPESTSTKVRTGLAAVDPATGEVVAFYGGSKDQSWDNAFSAKVQAGSTFKPYTLAAALDSGLPLSTTVNGNSPISVRGASQPIPNDSGRSYGYVDLIRATQNSVNTAFVDLGQKVGLDKVAKVAEAAGIPAAQLEAQRAYASFPLGVSSVSAVQNASGFASFANGGVHMESHVVKSVTDANGKKSVIKPKATTVVSEQAAADTIYAMEHVVKYGTGTGARLYDRPVAGKTGTTDSNAAVWFNGFTPQLATAVNMFRDDNKTVEVPGYGVQFGGQLPARIWKAFMTEALDGEPVEQFPQPSQYGYDRWDDTQAPRGDDRGPDTGYDDGYDTGYDRPQDTWPGQWNGERQDDPQSPPPSEQPATPQNPVVPEETDRGEAQDTEAPNTGQPAEPDRLDDASTRPGGR